MAEEKEKQGSDLMNAHLKKMNDLFKELKEVRLVVADYVSSVLKDAGFKNFKVYAREPSSYLGDLNTISVSITLFSFNKEKSSGKDQ